MKHAQEITTQVMQPMPAVQLGPTVSVIIVNLNTRDYLQRAIESVPLGFQRYPVEIIVVDNGSTDGSLEYVATLTNVRLITNTSNTGFAHANNQAIEVARGAYFLLLNSDAFLHDSCGDRLVDFLRAHPKVGLVVPTFEYTNRTWQPSFGSFPNAWNSARACFGIDNARFAYFRLIDRWARHALSPVRVDYGEGAGLLIRREVQHCIGNLSEDYFFYSEDVDYGLRAARAGWRTWWVPAARLTHVRGGSLTRKSFEGGVQRKFRSSMKFLACHYSRREARTSYVLTYWYHQRLVLTAEVVSRVPVLKKWASDRLMKYRVIRDLYRDHLPKHRFVILLQSESVTHT